DVLAGLERVKGCVAYRLGTKILDEMPLDPDDLRAAVPGFEGLPGWPESEGAEGARVPGPAAGFGARGSGLRGAPVWVTSWGPARSQTIVVKNPLARGQGEG